MKKTVRKYDYGFPLSKFLTAGALTTLLFIFLDSNPISSLYGIASVIITIIAGYNGITAVDDNRLKDVIIYLPIAILAAIPMLSFIHITTIEWATVKTTLGRLFISWTIILMLIQRLIPPKHRVWFLWNNKTKKYTYWTTK